MRNVFLIIGSIIPGYIIALFIIRIFHIKNNLEAMLIGFITGICVTSIVWKVVKKKYF